jgi:hypothetical protein
LGYTHPEPPPSLGSSLTPCHFTTKIKYMRQITKTLNDITLVLNVKNSYEVEEGDLISLSEDTIDKEYHVLETDTHGKYNVLVLLEVGQPANCRFTKSLTDDQTVILKDF